MSNRCRSVCYRRLGAYGGLKASSWSAHDLRTVGTDDDSDTETVRDKDDGEDRETAADINVSVDIVIVGIGLCDVALEENYIVILVSGRNDCNQRVKRFCDEIHMLMRW